MNPKVYVTLGFHINFYHSWRGDTPDEAGFGTDMRVIRGILDRLERAEAAGKQTRAYWDAEVYWTFQEILPKHCPDILERIRARVAAGLDEIIIGPFNNGANHAATRDEFTAAVQWAIENPWGSGLRQLFGRVAPFYRPQECMFTTGQEQILKECGVDGLLLYYGLVPFNTLGAFIPPLPLERRFNPFWLRTREDQPPLILFPCIGSTDLFEFISLENLLIDLHERQLSGEIQSDVLINLNADADLETWLPVKLPSVFKWFPNTGGLEEYIAVVNKYPWAEFTVPSEYLADHPPQGEALARQDLADGGFDGNYSWAEKYASLIAWTLLERSRLASLRAEALANRLGLDLQQVLWEGMDSVFFQRLIGLSTTHFGMSTPIINEERQARAMAILGGAAERAEDAERQAVRAWKAAASKASAEALYEMELLTAPPARDLPPLSGRAAIKLPVILPEGVDALQLESEDGRTVPASLTATAALPGGRRRGEMRFVAPIGEQAPARYRLRPASAGSAPPPLLTRLSNEWLDIVFSPETGIESFKFRGEEIGGADFLQPFIAYKSRNRPVIYPARGFTFMRLEGETWQGLQRAGMKTAIPMQTPGGEAVSQLTFIFTLFDELPYLYVDVEAAYAYTRPTEVIHNMMQKLRRLIDLRWIETAPCQITPRFEPAGGRRLRVWKHNYLGITSYYDLNYGDINPRNAELDSFNHQVTNGWVAVSDGQRGLLVGEDASSLASMAFCPMRLRRQNGRQVISLNPFGSYYGRMLDYSHLGGNGIGARLLTAFSGALQPNGPSYNGRTLRFSLMIAPYAGDEPPAELQADAGLHFYPPEMLIHQAPGGVEADIAEDIRRLWQAEERRLRQANPVSVDPPTAFLCNPVSGGVVLVWDAPRQSPVTGYEVAWRPLESSDWRIIPAGTETRVQISDLKDGARYVFKARAVCENPLNGQVRYSEWTEERMGIPGAVVPASLAAGIHRLPIKALIQLVFASLWAVLRARLRGKR